MTIQEFNVLSDDDKRRITFKGNFLTSNEDENYKIALYEVGELLVEVYYDKTHNSIDHFQAMIRRRDLESDFQISPN